MGTAPPILQEPEKEKVYMSENLNSEQQQCLIILGLTFFFYMKSELLSHSIQFVVFLIESK